MKPNNRYFTILLAGMLLALSACEKEIKLNLGDHVPKIVMNGIISPDSLIEISVSKSFLYTDTLSDRSLLKNAALTLFINGEERETMRMVRVDTVSGHDRLFEYSALVSVYRSTVYPQAGDRVRVEASAGGLQPAWAETTVPVPPQIHRIDTTIFFTSKQIINNGYSSGEGLYQNMRIKMAVTAGSSGADQRFRLRLRLMAEKIGEYPDLPDRYLYIYTNDDPVFEEAYRNSLLEDLISEGTSIEGMRHFDSALFSSKLFRDNSHTLDFSITDYYYLHTTYEEKEVDSGWGYPIYVPIKTEVFNPPIEVLFTAISPELYHYYLTGDYDPTSDEESFKLISEPEITFSNVHNGIGVVGAVSAAKAQINIPPLPGGKNADPGY